jgi:hypothetical protein
MNNKEGEEGKVCGNHQQTTFSQKAILSKIVQN